LEHFGRVSPTPTVILLQIRVKQQQDG